MRLLSEQAGRGTKARRALAARARECLAFTAIFLLVPIVGLSALVAPPWAVDQVTAPLWRTVWAPVGAALAAHHEAPVLQSTDATLVVAPAPANAAVQVAANEPTQPAEADSRMVLESQSEAVRQLVEAGESFSANVESVEPAAVPPEQEPRAHEQPAPAPPVDERGADSSALDAIASARTPELPDEDDVEVDALGSAAPESGSDDFAVSEGDLTPSDDGDADEGEEPSGADVPVEGNGSGNPSGNGNGNTNAPNGNAGGNGNGNGNAGAKGNTNGNAGGNGNGNDKAPKTDVDDADDGNPAGGAPENSGDIGGNGNGNGNGAGNPGDGPPQSSGDKNGNGNGNGSGKGNGSGGNDDNNGAGAPPNDPAKGKGKPGGRRRLHPGARR
jgi:hypothetical protein